MVRWSYAYTIPKNTERHQQFTATQIFQVYYLFYSSIFWQQEEVWSQDDFSMTEHVQTALSSGATSSGLTTLLYDDLAYKYSKCQFTWLFDDDDDGGDDDYDGDYDDGDDGDGNDDGGDDDNDDDNGSDDGDNDDDDYDDDDDNNGDADTQNVILDIRTEKS